MLKKLVHSKSYCNFVTENIKSSRFMPTRQPSVFACHGGHVTMWKIIYNFKNNVKMEKFLSQFASQFAEASIEKLVQSFNSQVGNRGWSSMRAAHDQALMAEFVRRGIDVSAVDNGLAISFAHRVVIDKSAMKLVKQD